MLLFLSLLFLLIGTGLILYSLKHKDDSPPIFFGFIGIALGVLFFCVASFEVVPAGQVGVRTVLGDVDNKVMSAGFHLINPVANIVVMDVRTQTYTMSSRAEEGQKAGNDAVAITMRDQSTPQMDLTVTFHLLASDAPKVYKNIGVDYVEKIVRPDIRSVIPRIATLFNSTDLYDNTKRTLFENLCKSQLDSIFRLRGVVLEDMKLREVVPSQEVQKAIDLKIASQQEAQAMEFKKQKAVQEAEILKIQARGIDSTQIIIGKSLSPSYLQWKYIEAMEKIGAGGNTMVFSPFDQKLAPMINAGRSSAK